MIRALVLKQFVKMNRFEIFFFKTKMMIKKKHEHWEQASKATQQIKAMESRLVKNCACRVVNMNDF